MAAFLFEPCPGSEPGSGAWTIIEPILSRVVVQDRASLAGLSCLGSGCQREQAGGGIIVHGAVAAGLTWQTRRMPLASFGSGGRSGPHPLWWSGYAGSEATGRLVGLRVVSTRRVISDLNRAGENRNALARHALLVMCGASASN